MAADTANSFGMASFKTAIANSFRMAAKSLRKAMMQHMAVGSQEQAAGGTK